MRTITVNVEIQFDQFDNEFPIIFTHKILKSINGVLDKSELSDYSPVILRTLIPESEMTIKELPDKDYLDEIY
jgi:hypothetical protein